MTSAPAASAHSAAAAQLSSSTGVSLLVSSVLARMKAALKAGPDEVAGGVSAEDGEGHRAVAAFAAVAAVGDVVVAVDEVVPVHDGHGGEGLVGQGVEAGVEHRHHHALAMQAQLVHGGDADLAELAGGGAVVEGGGAAG
jgi:hypothetical protein